MTRTEKHQIRKLKKQTKKVGLYIVSILIFIVLPVAYYLSLYKDVTILETDLDCSEEPCILSVLIENRTSQIKTGTIFINFFGVSAAGGPQSKGATISQRYFVQEFPYTLNGNEILKFESRYTGSYKTPVLTANVVPDKGI